MDNGLEKIRKRQSHQWPSIYQLCPPVADSHFSSRCYRYPSFIKGKRQLSLEHEFALYSCWQGFNHMSKADGEVPREEEWGRASVRLSGERTAEQDLL